MKTAIEGVTGNVFLNDRTPKGEIIIDHAEAFQIVQASIDDLAGLVGSQLYSDGQYQRF
jgi:hypothetical protein